MLATHTFGQGPALVLIHGFGLHTGIFSQLTQTLAKHFTITQIDLPGYGRNHHLPFVPNLEALAESVLAVAPTQALWLGWSLGGLVATQAALLQPDRIRVLVPMASNLQFVRCPKWPYAISQPILQSFANNLRDDYAQTLKRFIRLNCVNSPNVRQLIRELSHAILEPMPSETTLAQGLQLLLETKLQSQLRNLIPPTHYLLGEQDQLVPSALRDEILQHCPHMKVSVIPKAGHAPFLSHETEVIDQLIRINHEAMY